MTEKKNAVLKLRISSDEKAALGRKAAQQKKSVSAYVRDCTMRTVKKVDGRSET